LLCQSNMNKKYRMEVFNWLFSLFQDKKLQYRTFLLTGNILDRVMNKVNIQQNDIQNYVLGSL